jgi:NAD(P)-dependent dehydrogenase (short-subunit alcohol dehydrogenase family)
VRATAGAEMEETAMTLENQRIVIVGGSSGIGFAVAAGAADQGAKVVVGSSQRARVEAAVARLGGDASGFTLDVTDPADVERAFAAVGAFDHLVFTAGDWGGARRGSVKDIDLDAARAVFGVRFWGALAVVKAAQGRIGAGGSITLTNGMIAHRPRPGAALSSAMAGAVEHLARGLAVDLAPMRVNCVCPGYIRTGVWESIPAETREAQLAAFTKGQPLARVGEVAEAAAPYLYLMAAGYTTGQVLKVDGGMSVV